LVNLPLQIIGKAFDLVVFGGPTRFVISHDCECFGGFPLRER
jgi:hypothetical protein